MKIGGGGCVSRESKQKLGLPASLIHIKFVLPRMTQVYKKRMTRRTAVPDTVPGLCPWRLGCCEF